MRSIQSSIAPSRGLGLDFSSQLISGSTPLVVYSALSGKKNIVGSDATTSGVVDIFKNTQGSAGLIRVSVGDKLAIYNALGAGDLSSTIAAVGTGVFTDFWYGQAGTNTGGATNKYLFGDYTGSAGYGLAEYHGSSGSVWGVFDGTALNAGAVILNNGQDYVFVITRATASAVVKCYKDGALAITTANAPTLQAGFAIGSIGPNQYGTFGCEGITYLAGRLKGRSWSALEALQFSQDPWQILVPDRTAKLYFPYSADAVVTGFSAVGFGGGGAGGGIGTSAAGSAG